MAIEDLLKENIELMTRLLAKLNSADVPAKSKSRIAKPTPVVIPTPPEVVVVPVTPIIVAEPSPKAEPPTPPVTPPVTMEPVVVPASVAPVVQPEPPTLPAPPTLPVNLSGPTIDSVRNKLIEITKVYGTKEVEKAVAAFGATDLTELAADKLPSLDEWATAALAQVKP